MAKLIIMNGPQEGLEFYLTDFRYSIGRSDECDILINDPSVSRKHALLYREEQGIYAIEDLGSVNGILLNGIKISHAKLTNNVILKLGNTVMQFYSYYEERNSSESLKKRKEHSDETEEGYTVVESLSEDVVLSKAVKQDPELLSPQELTTANERLWVAYEISEFISSTFDLKELYKKILLSIFSTFQAERAAILFQDDKMGTITTQASMDSYGNEQEVPFSKTIVMNVIEKGESLLLQNAQNESFLDSSRSIVTLNIHSAMCVPIRTQNKIIGAITVDSPNDSQFSRNDLLLLTLVGNQAGIAIQNAWLVEQHIKEERLAAVGKTVASLAHCIKNILQGLNNASYMVNEGIKHQNNDLVLTAWPLLKESQERISRLVLNMLDYSKDRKPDYERADLMPHMKNIYKLMKERADKKKISLQFEYDPATPKVDCDPVAIYRATLNLVTNAIDAVDEKAGKVRLKVNPRHDGKFIEIRVIDNGKGISPEQESKVFEAFFSTKDSKGTGLGLAVTKKIIEEHKGDICIETMIGKGTTFVLTLPVNKAES